MTKALSQCHPTLWTISNIEARSQNSNIPTRLLLCSAHDERGFPGYRELSKTDLSNAFPLPNALPLPNAQVDLAVWVS